MALPVLNFPNIETRFTKNAKGTLQIFDLIRKKFVDLTPEEWVRQHLLHHLTKDKNVPHSLIAVEKQLILNRTKKRTDAVIYNPQLQPICIIECKAPDVEVTQITIDQALRYNLELNVPFIVLTNGFTHYFIELNHQIPKISNQIPDFFVLQSISS